MPSQNCPVLSPNLHLHPCYIVNGAQIIFEDALHQENKLIIGDVIILNWYFSNVIVEFDFNDQRLRIIHTTWSFQIIVCPKSDAPIKAICKAEEWERRQRNNACQQRRYTRF
ncbi:conserved hypothetical protein [Trichinella spiralis]|uniref:hypothetical protein n=1 Tax=Trichinella spiralis TaxID=6334 RepID=UPI0001EFBA73|nr:conserved hypothetical protein [Trichinella spiralis]